MRFSGKPGAVTSSWRKCRSDRSEITQACDGAWLRSELIVRQRKMFQLSCLFP